MRRAPLFVLIAVLAVVADAIAQPDEKKGSLLDGLGGAGPGSVDRRESPPIPGIV